jgi:tetratricopeptide (TPR) repeat protein
MPGEKKDEKWLVLAAYCAEGLERYDQAQGDVARALALNSASPAALNLKGVLTYKKGDTPAAEGFLRQALETDPGYGEPYANLGVIKWAAGSKEEALPLLEKGFILSPTATDLVTLYHSAITSMGEFLRAERAYEEAKGLFPLNRRITFLWIDVLLRQGKNEEAMTAIEQALVTFGIDDDLLNAALEIRNRIGAKEISKKPARKVTVSLCMIVKDEEQNLPQCLKNAAPIVDEMIVVDTGSKDKTKEIAKAFGAKVYDLEWTGSFAAARNFSITKASGKWILVLDADEGISRKDHNEMEKLFKKSQNGSVAFSFTTRNYIDQVDVERWEANHGEYGLEEAGIGWLPSEKTRLFPRDRRIGFENPVHEIVEPSLKKGGIKIIKAQAPIHHYGKLNKEKMKVKGQIYYELGKRKLSERENNLEALKELAIQANELKKYEEAVGLWQKVISLQPAMPSAFLNLGHAFLELGKYAEALTASARACELGPNMKEAAYNRSLCEICAGDLQNAISSLDTLLQKDPGYPPAIGLRGVAFFLEGKIEKGIESLERIKKMGANVSDVLAAHVSRLLRAGKEEYALSLLQAAAQSKSVNKEISALLKKFGEVPVSSHIQNPLFVRGNQQEEQALESSK